MKYKLSYHTYTNTNTNTTVLWLSDFAQDYPGEPVPEQTFIHSHVLWSSVIPYLLPPSIKIHGIFPVQYTCLTIFFHNHSPSSLWSTFDLAPSTSYSIHFFHPLSSFCSTCPYHHSLFCCNVKIMSSNPRQDTAQLKDVNYSGFTAQKFYTCQSLEKRSRAKCCSKKLSPASTGLFLVQGLSRTSSVFQYFQVP